MVILDLSETLSVRNPTKREIKIGVGSLESYLGGRLSLLIINDDNNRGSYVSTFESFVPNGQLEHWSLLG